MLEQLQIENILCLDIETVPQFPVFEDCPPDLQKLWTKKAELIRREGTEDAASLYGRAGIYAEFGKVICVTTGFLTYREGGRQFRLKSFAGDDERALLEELAAMFNRLRPGIVLCAHNGKEFDFPYLSRRMIIHGINLPSLLNNAGRKPWEVPFLDTMELWKFGDYKNYTPLNLLAYILGIPSPKDDIDGSMVGQVYWQDHDLPRIVHYCQKDVLTVMQILLRLRNEKLLLEEEVLVT
jgi:DNA polymerase elongation subunit (family B)